MTTQTPAIVLTEAATKMIKSDVTAFKSDRKRYASYVSEMNVTPETVAAHVALFRDAYKAATPKASGDEIKAYATKVRNGLNYQVGKQAPKSDDVTNLLTADGLATIADMIDADKGADVDKIIASIYAEVERRTASK